MRVMPYATHRGAMLLGNAPDGSPFAPRDDRQDDVRAATGRLTRRFELTSGDSGSEAPRWLTRGAERGWRSLLPLTREAPDPAG